MENYEMKQMYNQARQLNEERAQLYSKKRLINTITKKIKTTMIGAIAACEEHLGYLWGHGKPIHELNEQEQHWRVVWEELRNLILNKGNTQLRAALEELSCYSLNFNKYRTEFMISQDQSEGS
jgi:hypothetical protein